MIITQVRILNFKILENVDIEFDGGLTFLNANNGCGKTTFQEAIKWCLYGDSGPDDSEPLASKLASEHEDEVDVSVKIMVESPEKDERIEITRQVRWNVKGNRPSDSEVGGQLRIRISGLKNARAAEIVNNPRVWIEENFPSSLLSYFLFDGETMWKFFEPSVKSQMGAAIKSIAKVGEIDDLEKFFTQAAKKFRSDAAKKAGPDVITINQEYERENEELHRLTNIERPEAENEQLSWERKRQDAEKILSRLSDAKNLIEKIDEYDRPGGLLAQAKENIEARNNEFVEAFLERPYLAFRSALSEVPKLVEKAKREKWYPTPFSVAALEELLDLQRCICGNHLKPKSDAREEVLKIISERREMGEKGVELGGLASGVNELVGQVSEASQALHKENNSIKDEQEKADVLREERQRLLNALGSLSLPTAQDAQKHYDEALVQAARAQSKLEELVGKIEIQQKKVEAIRSQLTDAQGESEEELRLTRLAELAEQYAAASRVLSNEAVEDVKRRIKIAMDEAFAFIGDGEFSTSISDDFEIDTLDSKHRPAGLSEGQKMVRAYIFSIVLRKIVGYQFPLLVDTPLGRLDTRNSREAATLLSDFVSTGEESRGMQIIMSMHDAEYTPYVKQHFAGVKPQELYFYDEIPEMRSIVGEGIHHSWWELPGSWKDWKEGKVAQG
jgi:DNA sulfur modification protein DndD